MKTIRFGFLNFFIKRCNIFFLIKRIWLKKSEWCSEECLHNFQQKKIIKLIVYAEKNIPYYQRLMKKNNISSKNIRSIQDISQLPILTKKDIIEAGDLLISRKYPKVFLRKAFTGGTTGTPLHLYRTLSSIGIEHAFLRRQWDWAGIRFRDNCAFVKGRIISNKKGFIYDLIMKELHLSTYQLSIENAIRYLSIIKKYNCKAIVGYPSSILLLAKAMRQLDYQIDLKSILLTSETLTSDNRKFISESFGVPVYNYYGAAERVCYTFTCEKGNYHIQPEYGLTEFIPTENVSSYKIISSGFWNFAMPLIRYDTGDIAKLSNSKCECGRNFKLLENIEGREGDVLKTPEGNTFGVSILTHIFHVVCGIDCFLESQLLQVSLNQVIINYVPLYDVTNKQLQEYIEKLKKIISKEITFKFKKVNKIEKTASGKHRFVISQI